VGECFFDPVDDRTGDVAGVHNRVCLVAVEAAGRFLNDIVAIGQPVRGVGSHADLLGDLVVGDRHTCGHDARYLVICPSLKPGFTPSIARFLSASREQRMLLSVRPS